MGGKGFHEEILGHSEKTDKTLPTLEEEEDSPQTNARRGDAHRDCRVRWQNSRFRYAQGVRRYQGVR